MSRSCKEFHEKMIAELERLIGLLIQANMTRGEVLYGLNKLREDLMEENNE